MYSDFNLLLVTYLFLGVDPEHPLRLVVRGTIVHGHQHFRWDVVATMLAAASDTLVVRGIAQHLIEKFVILDFIIHKQRPGL